ncbi:exopolysaccharide Pel transporter PelG [Clostridium perfringens]|uniref:exopolysaccharide Pel transporter PelG n=1 Tax=Clostridium perfringens TaxID=1502 RepID=UPI0018E482A7|nr:exopolysaccharide Pel transporter PelG [Clostridium perfringens]MBI6058960.1 exopolysaccharide Pel transporter PelG [Clostridium perfringens]
MAGIGFELKKIIDKDNIFAQARVYFMSSLITVGPMIICITLFLVMQRLLKNLGASYANIQIFNAVIIYSFLISYISSNGISMLMSRYISDCIYAKKSGCIFESFLGVSIICSIISTIIMSLLLINSPLNLIIKSICFMITIILSLIWLEIIYLSAIKEYLHIVSFFLIGISLVILGTILGIEFLNIPPIYSALLFSLAGYIFIAISFMVLLYKVFGIKDLRLSNCLKFVCSIDKYYELLLIGLFLSFYDVPSFYAFLSVIPSVVIFTVKIETAIYPKYKDFYNFVRESGSINEIRRAKKILIDTIILHMTHMIKVQFIASFACIVFGFKILPNIGFASDSLEIFGILTLGAISYISMSFLILMLLYFDARKDALQVSLVFFITIVLFSIITVIIGQEYYGYGFFISSLISVVFAFNRINNFFRIIEYRTFASQPVFQIDKKGFFSRIYNFFNKENNKEV